MLEIRGTLDRDPFHICHVFTRIPTDKAFYVSARTDSTDLIRVGPPLSAAGFCEVWEEISEVRGSSKPLRRSPGVSFVAVLVNLHLTPYVCFVYELVEC